MQSRRRIRDAFEPLLHQPRATTGLLLILTFCVGAVTAIFSVAVPVLEQLPYPAPERLVRVFGTWEHGSREGTSPPDFLDYRSRLTAFESVASISSYAPLVNLSGRGRPEQLKARNVTIGFFHLLGIVPAIGRDFIPEEERRGGPKAVMLSYDTWRRLFGADEHVIGTKITINDAPVTIVGVLPKFFNMYEPAEVWTPLQAWIPEFRATRFLVMLGRLRDGATLQSAELQMNQVAAQLDKENPAIDNGWRIVLKPLTGVVVPNRPGILICLLAAALFLLLTSRAHAAVMAKMASTGEHLQAGPLVLLGLAGGAAGWVLAVVSVHAFQTYAHDFVPRLNDAVVGGWELLLALALSIALSLASRLRMGPWSAQPRALLLTEGAVACILLAATVYLGGRALMLQFVDPGFRTDHVLTARVVIPVRKYLDPHKQRVFWRQVIENARKIPGVTSVASTSEVPLSGMANPTPMTLVNSSGKTFVVYVRSVTPDYLSAMNVPLTAGRPLTYQDHMTAPKVVLINAALSKNVFAGQNPLGQRVKISFDNWDAEVVGVVGNIQHDGLNLPPFPEVYVPNEQAALFSYTFVVVSQREPVELAGAVRAAVSAVDRDQSAGLFQTMSELVGRNLRRPRLEACVALWCWFIVAIPLAGSLYLRHGQRYRRRPAEEDVGGRLLASAASPR